MKKTLQLFFLASTAIFISCSSDDGDDPIAIDESLIAGVWDLTALTIENGKTTTQASGQNITIDFSSVGKDFTSVVTFSDSTSPKTYTSTGGYTSVITTTILGQTMTQEETISDFLGTGEWRVEGNMLFTTTDGEEQGAEITVLDSETLSLKIDLNESFEEQGVSLSTSGTVSATMKRK